MAHMTSEFLVCLWYFKINLDYKDLVPQIYTFDQLLKLNSPTGSINVWLHVQSKSNYPKTVFCDILNRILFFYFHMYIIG